MVGAAGVAQAVDGVPTTFRAVSKPMVKSVPAMSLSMVPGRPMQEALFGQLLGTHVGAVTADDHQGVDAVFLQVFDRFGTDFRILEGGGTGEPRNVPPRFTTSSRRCDARA